MNKTTILTTVFLFSFSLFVNGQALEESLTYMKENTLPVQGKKTEYRQTFSSDPDNPYMLSFSITDTRKGEELIQTVNAIDLNPYMIKFEPQKEVVEITAGVQGGKDLVKIVEGGETKNYDDELVFYASGIEEARGLTDALKKITEFAGKHKDSILSISNSKEALLNHVAKNIKDVTVNDDVFTQSFSVNENKNNLVTFVTGDASGDKVEEYSLNLADLNVHKLDFFTKRTDVLIPLEIKGDKDLIKYTENGETGNYTSSLELRAPSIEEARLLEARLEALITLAEKEKTTDYSTFTYKQCVDLLKDRIGEVVINQDAYNQSFALSPVNDLVYTYTVEDVSEGENHAYTANAADFGKVPVSFNTHGNGVFITLQTTGDRDLIAVKENNEDADFEKSFTLRAPDIEAARAIAGAFTRLNELAVDKMASLTAFKNADEAMAYVTKAIDQVVINTDTYLQKLDKDEKDNCLMHFHSTDVSEDTKYDYDFNLKDIDPYKIQFNTRGNEVFLTMQVKGGNDLVKKFENGEVDKFTDGFEIRAKDIEQARKLETALRMITESCGEK